MKKKFLLPHQTYFTIAPFLFQEMRFFIFTAGYGAGKTSSISTSILSDVIALQGKEDREGHNPRLILGGVSLGHLKKTTLAYILEDLKNSKTPYDFDTKDNILKVGNVEVYLVSLSRPSAIMGFDVVAAYGDEVDDLGAVASASNIDLTFEAVKALNERTRQVIPGFRAPYIKLASTSQGQLGLYRVVTQFDKEETAYIRIKARTKDNFYLPKDYVESQYRFYTETERKVYLEGEFLAVGALRIFPDFDWERNYIKKPLDKSIDPGEELFWSQDFNTGYFRGCIGTLRGNTLFIIKRYEFVQIAEAPSVVRHDFPYNRIIWIPDASSNKDILTFVAELRKYNIFWAMRSKNPNVEDTVFLVNKLLYTQRLMFGELAKETAEACALGRRDAKTGQVPKGIGQRSPIHDIDAVRMLCYFIIFRPAMKDIRMLTVQRHIQMLKENLEDDGEYEEAKITETAGGFTVLNPAAINTNTV